MYSAKLNIYNIYLILDNLLKTVESNSSRSFVQEDLLNTKHTASNQIVYWSFLNPFNGYKLMKGIIICCNDLILEILNLLIPCFSVKILPLLCSALLK